ncbi:MAG: MFS transporter [Paracoccaceae bacterium]
MPNDHERRASALPSVRLASAGFVATAVAFGPARMGFGLFLPAFNEDFALSTSLSGLIASGGFLAFLLALPLAAWLGLRIGQRLPVYLGALSAALGFAVVAGAESVGALATGVALAGASAGFCWAPFNDAAERVVPERTRPAALSAVSTGTTLGVAAAGALARATTVAGFDWRTAWSAFAAAGLVAAVAALLGVPGGRAPAAGGGGPGFLRRRALPLYAAALLFGATNAIYLAFAADRVVDAGGLPGLPDDAAAAVIFLGYGACGVVGLATGWIEARIGLAALLSAIFAAFAASLALVALTPSSWAGLVASAGLHGAAVMTISAVLSFWSLRLFPGRGSLGFTAALVAAASGSVLGPALAGPLVSAAGAEIAFLLLALPPSAIALAFATQRAQALS